jgi:hypothetical protein
MSISNFRSSTLASASLAAFLSVEGCSKEGNIASTPAGVGSGSGSTTAAVGGDSGSTTVAVGSDTTVPTTGEVSMTTGSASGLTGATSTACDLEPGNGETTMGCEIPVDGEACSCQEACPGGQVECLNYQPDGDSCTKPPDGHVMNCDLPCLCLPVFYREDTICDPPTPECNRPSEYNLAALECALGVLRDRVPGKLRWGHNQGFGSQEYATLYLVGENLGIEHSCLQARDSTGVSPPYQGALKSPNFFAQCLAEASFEERLKCLKSPFEASSTDALPDCGYCQ